MAPLGDEKGLQLPSEKGFPGVRRAGDQHDGGPVAEMLRALLQTHFSLDPGEIPPPGLVPQELLLVVDELGNDPAARDIEVIHEDEPAGRLK